MDCFDLYRQSFIQTDWNTTATTLSATRAEWLLYKASLTNKLQQSCQQFQINIVKEGWQTVQFNPDFAKKEKLLTPCWVREVLIYCDQQASIFAQTVLPKETIENVAQIVPTLGEKAIGLWLFPQEPRRLNLAWRYDLQTQTYARRSTLLLKGYPLIIQELFLPKFPFEATLIKA